jgi:hypothetical protein
MKRKRPRFKHGLLRGGLGRMGWVPSLGSFAAAWFVRPDIVLYAGLVTIPICIWCALGLRADHSAGERSDFYVDDESYDLKEMVSGDLVHPVRRHSNAMIFFCVLGCLIALCRQRFAVGPIV